jgi:hypothetical protein
MPTAPEITPDFAELLRKEREEGRKEGRKEGLEQNLSLKEAFYACTFLVIAVAYLLSR